MDFRSLLNKENGHDVAKENQAPPPPATAIPPGGVGLGGVDRLEDSAAYCGGSGSAESAVVTASGGGRWDKSLGVLCQKFIMLFLITPVRFSILS